MQNAPLGAFCNTFDLHKAIIGLGNQFLVFLRVAVLHRFYCIHLLVGWGGELLCFSSKLLTFNLPLSLYRK